MGLDWQGLIAAALEARELAYAPYSGFKVGAALAGVDGKIFTGCNVENLSYGLTLCAERSAIASAVAGGRREFAGIAIAADSREPISPCGACRQVLAEFGDMAVISVTLGGERFESSMGALLPRPRTGILDED